MGGGVSLQKEEGMARWIFPTLFCMVGRWVYGRGGRTDLDGTEGKDGAAPQGGHVPTGIGVVAEEHCVCKGNSREENVAFFRVGR